MFRYAMKAAARSRAQLADRVAGFSRVGVSPKIELYLAGPADVFGPDVEDSIKNCRSFPECEYIVHYPILDPASGYIFDPYCDENEKLKRVLDFCERISSDTLVMHRCYGFDRGIDKQDAEDRFLESVTAWNSLLEGSERTILVENYGFVWLPGGFGREYVTSPLDHFFPWDITAFHENIKRLGLSHIGILLDTAHAVLSSNMFNMLKRRPELLEDRRFQNIYSSDLQMADFLRAEDFVLDCIGHFHVSDSFVWSPEDGTGDMTKYLYTENLPIGDGNIDYRNFFSRHGSDKTLIMEINPAGGDHCNNTSQAEAVEFFINLKDKGESVCA